MVGIYLLALVIIALFALPGWLLVRLHPSPDEPAVERGFLSLAMGFYLVSWTAVTAVGFLGVAAPVFVRWWVLAGVSVLWTLGLGWRLRRRSAARTTPRAPFGRWDLVVVVALVAVFCLALLHYDRLSFDEERCIVRSCMLPYYNYMHPGMLEDHFLPSFVFDRNAFLLWNAGQREGMIFVLVPWLATLQFLGFRVCFAFSHLVVAGASYLLARRLLGSRPMALLVLLAASLNPYMLRMTAVDDNLLAAAVGALSLALLLRRPVRWLWLMLPYGLFLVIRHEALLTLPALLAYAWASSGGARGRRRTFLSFAVGLPVILLPSLIYHAALFFGMGVLYEAFVPYAAPIAHSLGGMELEVRGLLGWPFAPLSRSAYGAFPTLVQFPLALANGLGLLSWALVPAGCIWLWRRHRAFLLLGLAWFVPFNALLLVQGNWTEADKMGIPNTVLTPVLVCVAAGLLWTWGSPAGRARRVGLVAASLALLLAAVLGLGRVRAPVDPRGFGLRPFYIGDEFPLVSIPENPALIAQEQRALAAPRILPFQDRLEPGVLARDLHELRRRWATLLQDLRYPSFSIEHPATPYRVRSLVGLDEGMFFPVSGLAREPMPSPEPSSADTVTVALELGQPPGAAGPRLEPAGSDPAALPFIPGSPLRVVDLELPWAEAYGTLVVLEDTLGDPIIALLFHSEPWSDLPPIPGVRTVSGEAFEDGRLVLTLPAGGWIGFGQYSSFFPTKLHYWLLPSPGGAEG
jgi:hypothetical protein